jgi:hypothetical protein
MTPEDWTILADYGVTPDNLEVAGSLYLIGTGITDLPDNLIVGERIYLSRTGIKPIWTDPRDYDLYYVPTTGRPWIIAGCRKFRSVADAVAHWSAPDYPDQERGAQFVARIREAAQ